MCAGDIESMSTHGLAQAHADTINKYLKPYRYVLSKKVMKKVETKRTNEDFCKNIK